MAMQRLKLVETGINSRKGRNGFAEWSTGSFRGTYYSCKGNAINAFDGYLQDFDLCFDREDLYGFDGDTGRKDIAIVDEFGNQHGRAILSWYRMPSGNYEFVGYIA